jgi:flagellar biosynthesis/type III secretory pathway chaperone
MNTFLTMLNDLREHQAICRQLLMLAEKESQALRQNETPTLQEITNKRRTLLPGLSDSLERVRQHRTQWQLLTEAERNTKPEIAYLIRQTQDLIMKVILMDRENEQGMLRRGLIPARELPPANQSRPHFVANLYRRQSSP